MLINDGRPNGEMLLCFGTVQDSNLSDCLYFNASLVAADKCARAARRARTQGRPARAVCGAGLPRGSFPPSVALC